MARPPSDIRLRVPPNKLIKKNVLTTVRGRVVAAISVERGSRRNRNKIKTARRLPTATASRMLATASRTNPAMSYTKERWRVEGMAEPKCAAAALTWSATCRIFPPI